MGEGSKHECLGGLRGLRGLPDHYTLQMGLPEVGGTLPRRQLRVRGSAPILGSHNSYSDAWFARGHLTKATELWASRGTAQVGGHFPCVAKGIEM